MSAPVSDDVLRELGALPRKFRSVRAAILFFDGYAARKDSITQDLSRAQDGGNPVSREQREQDRATYDRLLLVFRARDPGVDEENLFWSLQTTMDQLSGRSGFSTVYLSERHGFKDERSYLRYVDYAERVLRNRMRAHGVWKNTDHCACGCGVEQVEADR